MAGARAGARREDLHRASRTGRTIGSVLLVFRLFAVLQVAVFFYVRNVVAASAADGARFAAAAGVDYARGGFRASDLVGKGLTEDVAHPCSGRDGRLRTLKRDRSIQGP